MRIRTDLQPIEQDMRYFARYTKKGLIRFLGHLDTQRLFIRALKRCRYPLKYSEGFSPKPEISFAYPLSVGTETEGDYFEFSTTQEIDISSFPQEMSRNLPDGMDIVSAGIPMGNVQKIMNIHLPFYIK